MTAPEWRDCADPDELAAAVAAGVEVLRMRGGGWVPSALTHRDDFAWFLTHGTRYQLPTSWKWRPRAVPEPETERVDALKVLRDRSYRVVWMKDHAAPACSIGPWNDDVAVWSAAECRGYVQPIAPDGTVEVLKDGGQ